MNWLIWAFVAICSLVALIAVWLHGFSDGYDTAMWAKRFVADAKRDTKES